MKSKLLNFLLIVTSLIGYLEWGEDGHAFLFEAEGKILSKLFSHPSAVLHPFTIVPLLAQLLLIFTLFQKQPGKRLTLLCISGLGLLLGFMLVIGVLALNYKIILSTVPFMVMAVLTVKHQMAKKVVQKDHQKQM